MFDGDGVSPHLQDPSSLEVLDPFSFVTKWSKLLPVVVY